MGGGRREEGTMGEEERRRIPPRIQAQTPQGPCCSPQWLERRAKGTCVNSTSIPRQGSDIIITGGSVADCD